MTIIQSASFVGTPIEDVRPNRQTRMLQQCKNIAYDQARNYEQLTGIKVPSSTTIAATPHVHDGTTGNVIPIPLFHQWVGATLNPSSSNSIDPAGYDGVEGYAPFLWPMYFAPAGVTSVRAVVRAKSAVVGQWLRVQSYNSALSSQATYSMAPLAVGDDWVDYYADVLVAGTGGVVNLLAFECVEASEYIGYPLPNGGMEVHSVTIYPLVGSPRAVGPYADARPSGTGILVPAASTHISAYGFTSFDDAMFNDDRGVSSYILLRQMLNCAQLYEVATGLPASDNADGHSNDIQWDGHCHGASTTVSPSSDMGADMDQALLAHSFGVARTKTGGVASRLGDDESAATAADWTGRIFGLSLLAAASTTARTVARIPFRMPAALSTNIQASTKIRFAAFANVDTAKVASMEVIGTIYNSAMSSGGTATTLTFSSLGRAVSSATIDYYGAGGVDGIGEEAVLEVQMRFTAAPSGDPAGLLYGVCLYYGA